VSEHEFTVIFPFGGSGGAPYGIQRAVGRLFGHTAKFKILGGFDIDPAACADFHLLTNVPELCADVRKLTVADLHAAFGTEAPDVVVGSPPCQGSSKLISDEKAASQHYEDLNELALVWTRLMLAAWSPGPKLVIMENVPNVTVRAKPMLAEMRGLYRGVGYVVHDGTHELGDMATVGGHYDAGELGGLAQKRKRWLMALRDPKQCAPFLYQTPKRRVRGVGEVLGPMPMPGDPAGGPMHALPRISTLNWLRLALIPAGGDWRDLAGVLKEHQQRRDVFRRNHLSAWDQAAPTIGGPGTNGPYGVADPRIRCTPHAGAYGMLDWAASSKTVTGSACIDNSPVSVADPRVVPQGGNADMHHGKYKVRGWDDSAGTVVGATRVGSGAQSVADPRAKWFPGALGVVPWGSSVGTVTGNGTIASGAFSVADPRVSTAFDRGYSVIEWSEAANTIAGGSMPGQGAYSVADPRCPVPGAPGMLPLSEALKMLEGPGPWAIVDPQSDGAPLAIITDLRKPPPFPLVIVAEDGTWHRPLTTLELAVLQGLDWQLHGAALKLTGDSSTAWRSRIGNMIPAPAMEAIGVQLLITLLASTLGTFTLSSGGNVWVEPEHAGMLQ